MATGRPGRGADQFPLRLPEGLRDRIKASADRNGRSMNDEIVSRLEQTFLDDDKMDEATTSNQDVYFQGTLLVREGMEPQEARRVLTDVVQDAVETALRRLTGPKPGSD